MTSGDEPDLPSLVYWAVLVLAVLVMAVLWGMTVLFPKAVAA